MNVSAFLKQDGLVIRQLDLGHLPSIAKIFGYPSMRKFILECGCEKPDEVVDFYREAIRDCADENWAILLKAGAIEVFAGMLEFYPTPNDFTHAEIGNNTFSLGAWINPDVRRRGVAKHAVKQFIGQVFKEKPEIEWVQAGHAEKNDASKALLQSCGFHFYTTIAHLGQTDYCYVMNRDPNYDYSRLAPSLPEGKGTQRKVGGIDL